jgi:2-(1,2-epoxy-1,2-dihydrophenyl)acetyl-CoA isomerase
MEHILFDIKEGVGIVKLNRPEKFNAFNRTMALELQQILNTCAGENRIRAVYLTGVGKAFSTGQDLNELLGPNAPGIDIILKEHYNPIVTLIRNLEKPVVCAVNGVAAGAGANIALCCDIIVATASASFIQAFSKIGLIPDSGGTFTLPRLIGWQKASALMMLGDKINAGEAEKMGMLYATYPDEVFEMESMKIASRLATMPTRALAYTKMALQQSLQNSFGSQLEAEDKLQALAVVSSDFKEGVSAFVEKRKPMFKGE